LKNLKRIYFLGIGGIGMSALARYFNDNGIEICGYDKTETTLTKKLVEEGMKIHYDDNIRKIPEGIDLVIYTPAIPSEHDELNYFKRNFYQLKKRAQVLGTISKTKKTIAVAGTHGKTTTSSFISHVLNESDFHASALVGGIMTNYDSNYLKGNNGWIIVEADEYDRSFLHLSPDIAIVMSMDADHLDIYGKHDEMKSAFEAFTLKIKRGGKLIIKSGLKDHFSQTWQSLIDEKEVEVLEFGGEGLDNSFDNLTYDEGNFSFDFKTGDQKMKNLEMQMPGRHNAENATAALLVANLLELDEDKARKALKSFKGIKRRFEYVIKKEGIVFIDDYAHHPAELNAAITTVRKLYPEKKITGVFQPHLYSRTKDFSGEFAKALDQLDEAILLNIYPARELPIEGVNSKLIVDQMESVKRILIDKRDLIEEIKNRKIEVLITLGAGDIDTEIEKIREVLEKYDE
jgi:UDP-N-acetylmuramate--alanine ligase